MILQITGKIIATIKDQIQHYYPMEICGILFGTQDLQNVRVVKIVPTTNVLESNVSFEIGAGEFIEAVERAQAMELEHLGFYHSHPGIAYPSSTDVRYMSLWPNIVWIVISSVDYSIGAYQVREKDVATMTIEIS